MNIIKYHGIIGKRDLDAYNVIWFATENDTYGTPKMAISIPIDRALTFIKTRGRAAINLKSKDPKFYQ